MNKLQKWIAIAMALTLILASAVCLAEPAAQPAPDIEYVTLTAERQTLAAPEHWLECIAPAGAQVATERAELYPGYFVTTLTGEGFSIDYAEDGMLEINIDSDIPIAYRSEGEGMYLPPPSKVEGKYTQQEAEELALSFLRDTIGMDVSQLALRSVTPEDASKERSRAYKFEFGYQFGGIDIVGPNSVSVAVNDDGVVHADAHKVLSFAPGEPVGDAKLLTEDELMARLEGKVQASLRMPVYSMVNYDDVRIAWLLTERNADGAIAFRGGIEYDMRTGDKLTREEVW